MESILIWAIILLVAAPLLCVAASMARWDRLAEKNADFLVAQNDPRNRLVNRGGQGNE